MRRREFSLGLGTALLAAPIAGPALAEIGSAFIQGSLSALRIRFEDGETDTVQAVEMTDTVRAVGLRWTQHLPTYFEDRVDLSDSVASGFLRTPFARRWADARPIGGVEKIGDRLVLRVDDLSGFAGRRIVVGAGDYSWDLPGPSVAMTPGGGSGRPVGALRLGTDDRILIRLRATPSF